MISVIIPVYNVSKYLSKCLDSVVSQSYSDLEILLIDDGSTDDSGEICELYAKNDLRVTVYHNSNKGQAYARNYGIDHSSGEYISFIDSDDSIAENMLEILYKELKEHNAEIACCDVEMVDNHMNHKSMTAQNYNLEILNRNQAFSSMCSQSKVRFQVWNKLYTRTVIGDIRFKENQKYEEIYFQRKVLARANKIIYTDAKLYYYLISRPGNTNSAFHIGKLSVFNEMDALIEDLDKYKLNDAKKNALSIRQMFAINLSIEAMDKKLEKSKKEFIKMELIKSNLLCKEYSCGNKYLGMICAISPFLAVFLRKVYHQIVR